MKRLLPIFLLAVLAPPAYAAPQLGGPVSPDGKVRVTVDVPQGMRHHNTAGTDGSGLCVWWSITHAARWQDEGPLADLGSWMQKKAGGGWPQRVDQILTAKPFAGVDYAQYEGTAPTILKAALASKRLPCVTYNGRDPHYSGRISHMVNCVHFDEQWVCILDNNYIGPNELVWMTPAEFSERWISQGTGWAVVLLRETPDARGRRPWPDEARGIWPGQDVANKYEWWFHPRDPGRLYLYCTSTKPKQLVGGWDVKGKYFRFYVTATDHWLPPGEPPFDPPTVPMVGPERKVGDAEDWGLTLQEWPPLQKGEERWTRKGQPSSAAEILAVLQPRPVPPPPAPVPVPNPQPGPNPNPQPADPGSSSLGSALITGLAMLILSLFAPAKKA